MKRLDVTDHDPIIESRPSVKKYFVVFPSLGVELAPAFDHLVTAREIARNARDGTPFFTMIPTVTYRTVYPRPNLIMPKLDVNSALRFRELDYGD